MSLVSIWIYCCWLLAPLGSGGGGCCCGWWWSESESAVMGQQQQRQPPPPPPALQVRLLLAYLFCYLSCYQVNFSAFCAGRLSSLHNKTPRL